MASVRGAVFLSRSVRLPAHSCCKPHTVPRTPGTLQCTVRCRSRGPPSRAYSAVAAVSDPHRSNTSSLFSPRYTKDGLRQWGESKSLHFPGPLSVQGAATVSSSFNGRFASTGRSMPTSQSAAPVTVAPAASLARDKPVPVPVSATASEGPSVIHQGIRSEEELFARMSALKTYLLAANWQDYLSFVMNSAFWEAEMRLLEVEARPYKNTSARVEELLRDLRRLLDLMAQASDVRDHINQILELGSRATGLAGTGLNAADKVENFEEHVQAAVAEYDRLLKEYPEYCSLVDDCLGSGIAMMRQKQRFTFSALHRFFY